MKKPADLHNQQIYAIRSFFGKTGLEPPFAHHADGGDPGGAVPVRLGAHDADRPLGEGEGAEPDGYLLQEGQPGGRIRSR